MGTYELLDHTADVAVRATGGGFAEALAWLARGMFAYMADPDTVRPLQTVEVAVSSHDRESLTVDWLNELLYRYEAEGFLPCEFQVSVNDAHTGLRAVCKGEPVDPKRHRVGTSVKAATYHGLAVRHNGAWDIAVVLDV